MKKKEKVFAGVRAVLVVCALGGLLAGFRGSAGFTAACALAMLIFSLGPGRLKSAIKGAIILAVVILLMISGFHGMKAFIPLLLLMPAADLKILRRRRIDFSEFKKEYGRIEEKYLEWQRKNDEIQRQVKALESEIERYEKLYELSRDIESVSDGRELARKSLEALSLKLGIEKLAFFGRKNNRSELLASKNLNAEEIDGWKSRTGNAGESPGKFFKFSLEAGGKKLGEVMLKGRLDTRQLKNAEVIVSQVALGYEKTVLYEKVRELSRIDGLTGLYLRKYFMSRLEEEINRARRYDYTIAFLMCDLDDFKKYNDTYGHPMGDKVLAAVADTINSSIYQSDMAGRYGGEEFCIYMPVSDRKQVRKRAENIRKKVQDTTSITVSVGIAYFPDDGSTSADMIKAADAMLYRSKETGKNKVTESV